MQSVRHTVEVAISPQGVLLAYADPALDGASRLRLDSMTGSLTAVLEGETGIPCGQFSAETCEAMRVFESAVWARMAGLFEDTVAVAEIALEWA